MPKTYYANETDIPENLKGAYEAKNGRWELTDLDSEHPTIVAKTGLENTQKTLKGQITTLTNQANDLQQKLTIAETKVLSDGMVAVSPDVKELGEAAKTAGLVKDEIPTLKTAADTIRTELDSLKGEKVVDEVAEHFKFNSRFKAAAKDKGLKFESTTEGEGENAKTIWSVVGEKDGQPVKTKVEDFLKTDSYFKEFAETFVDSESGNTWVRQGSGKDTKPSNEFEEIRNEMKGKQEAVQPKDNDSVLAALSGKPAAKA